MATSEDCAELAATLASAFADDPLFSWIAGSTEGPGRLERLFRLILVHESAGLAETYMTDDGNGPPGYRHPGVVGQLRLLPQCAAVVGWSSTCGCQRGVEPSAP